MAPKAAPKSKVEARLEASPFLQRSKSKRALLRKGAKVDLEKPKGAAKSLEREFDAAAGGGDKRKREPEDEQTTLAAHQGLLQRLRT